MSNIYLQSFPEISNLGYSFIKKTRMSNFHYDMGIKSRPRSQIFPTLAILVACKLRNISHSELAV